MDYTKFVIQYRKNGWVPVKWSHHPEHIKNAIKAVKFRPQAKQCFANSQKLVIQQRQVPLKYCEGIVQVEGYSEPIIHAWVEDESATWHDVTLGKMPKVLRHHTFGANEILENMVKTLEFCPIDLETLTSEMQSISALSSVVSQRCSRKISERIKWIINPNDFCRHRKRLSSNNI